MLWVDGVVRRHRRVVVGVWLLALLAALPLAVRQSDHLIGGGFEDPSSQSSDVQRALRSEFPGVARAVLVSLLVPQPDARSGDLVAAIHSLDRKVARVKEVRTVPAQRRVALADAGLQPHRPVVVFLRVSTDDDRAIDVAR